MALNVRQAGWGTMQPVGNRSLSTSLDKGVGVSSMTKKGPEDTGGSGAACVTRTRDPRITNAMLYRLS